MDKKLFSITVLATLFACSAAAMERNFRTPPRVFFGIRRFGDSEAKVPREIFKLSEATRQSASFIGKVRGRENRRAVVCARGKGFWSRYYSDRQPVNRRLFDDEDYDYDKPSFLNDDPYEE